MLHVEQCKCGNKARAGQRTCNSCHAANMRAHRATHNLTESQRLKDKARSYAGVYKRRGKLIPEPCSCGSTDVEMHHEDYTKPLDVTWLCRECHLSLHETK